MNVEISQKHDNVYHIRKNYTLKSIDDDEIECINYKLSDIHGGREKAKKKKKWGEKAREGEREREGREENFPHSTSLMTEAISVARRREEIEGKRDVKAHFLSLSLIGLKPTYPSLLSPLSYICISLSRMKCHIKP